MASFVSDAIPVWPDAVRDYVEYRQETAYRDLGDRIKSNDDPLTIRAKLLGQKPPAVKLTPEQLADRLGLTGKFSAEEWERAKRLIEQDEAHPTTMPAPTRYEDPATYQLMNEIRALIHQDAAKLGQPIDFPPFLASLPSGDVNATIFIPPGSTQPVMCFEQGLLQFLRDFAALAAWAAPELPPEDLNDATLAAIPQHHTMTFEASSLFASSLRSYVVEGNPAAGAARVPRAEANAFLTDVLFIRMMKFVFVHEYEHLRAGHLAREDQTRDALWTCEYEADAAGAAFVTQIGGWALGFWACDLVLIAFNFLDRALGLFRFGGGLSWISPTHPDAIRRRRALHESVSPNVPEASLAAAGNLVAMDEALFQALWEIAWPLFLLEHKSGARPSPIWSERINRSMTQAA